MKKIVIFLLIIIFSAQICFAQDNDTDENFEQYFQTDEGTALDEQQPDININTNQTPTSDASGQKIEGTVEYSVEMPQENDNSAIYLGNDLFYKKLNLTHPKRINSDNLSINKKKPSFAIFDSNLSSASKFTTQEYDLGTTKTSLSHQFGDFSFGTKYSTSLDDSSQINYTTAIFSRYENKHLAFTTTFLKSTGYDYASYNDKIQIAPELKLTNRLSLLDVMETDVLQLNKSNEIVLRYRPNLKKYADDVELELGAEQSFYDDNFVKSSLKFSTNFKL